MTGSAAKSAGLTESPSDADLGEITQDLVHLSTLAGQPNGKPPVRINRIVRVFDVKPHGRGCKGYAYFEGRKHTIVWFLSWRSVLSAGYAD